MKCMDLKGRQWTTFTGLAGGAGGLILLSLVALRYSS
jgi:hypothetical protein